MVVDAYSPSNLNQVHEDVLLKSRDACYKARDAFYPCLEKECGKKQTEIASVGLLYPKECSHSRTEFVKSCRSWVKHYDREHCRNKRVARLLDDGDERKGPMSLPQPYYTFKPSPST